LLAICISAFQNCLFVHLPIYSVGC
jgi:hypothetical protein